MKTSIFHFSEWNEPPQQQQQQQPQNNQIRPLQPNNVPPLVPPNGPRPTLAPRPMFNAERPPFMQQQFGQMAPNHSQPPPKVSRLTKIKFG